MALLIQDHGQKGKVHQGIREAARDRLEDGTLVWG